MVCRTFIGQRFQRDDCVHRFTAADSGAARRHYCRLCNGDALAATFIIAYIGNLLPIPFILLFIRFIFRVLKKTPLHGLVAWCERTADAQSDKLRKYAYWGVYLFVALPLPGTGAWMGALISALLHMDPKKTFPVIMLGVLTAGMIVSVLSFGILGNII